MEQSYLNYYSEVHKINRLLAERQPESDIVQLSDLSADDVTYVISRIHDYSAMPQPILSTGRNRLKYTGRLLQLVTLIMVIINYRITLLYVSFIGIVELVIYFFCKDEIPVTPINSFLDQLAEELELKHN